MIISLFPRFFIGICLPALLTTALVANVEKKSNSLPLEVSLQTSTPYHLLFVGQENQLSFQFKNPGAQAVRFHFDAVLTSYNSTHLKLSENLSAAAGAMVTFPITLSLPERGIWYIDYTLKPAIGPEQTDRISFAYLKPAGPRKGPPDGILFSVDGGISASANTEETNRDIELASLCGIDICRCTLQFGDAEPKRGEWDEAAFQRFSNALDFALKRGVSAQFILCYNARWDNPPDKQNSTNLDDFLFSKPQPEPWREYVRAVVNRYHDRVKYWEIWNEADIVQFWTASSDDYLQLLKIAHDEIKKIDPSRQVMTCGFAHFLPREGPGFIETVATKGADYFDILAIHQHGPFEDFQYAVDLPLFNLQARLHPPKPLYFNETALSRESGDHPPVEALWEKLSFAWAHGAMGYTWYNLRDGYLDLKKQGHPWGMFTKDYYPTPTYVAYNTLVTYLRGKHYAGPLILGSSSYAYCFAGSNACAIMTWNTRDTTQALSTALRVTGATKAFFVDPMGNCSDAVIQDGLVVLRTDNSPRLLILEGKDVRLETCGSLVEIKAPPFVDPGKDISLQVALYNPFTTVKTFSLRSQFPGEISGPDRTYVVKPKMSRQIEWNVSPVKETRTNPASALAGIFSCALSDTSWHDDLPVSFRFGIQIPIGAPASRSPDFHLFEKKNVVNLYENDPQNQKLLWQGPEDLSAQVWLQRDPEFLEIHAEVRDDHPSPPHNPERLWDGDCLQFAFRIEGQKGFWRFAAGLLNDKPEIQCWAYPGEASGTASLITTSIAYQNSTWSYDFKIPRAALDCQQSWPDRMSFNLMANDSDNDHFRKQWIEVAPGLGRNISPGFCVPLSFAKSAGDQRSSPP